MLYHIHSYARTIKMDKNKKYEDYWLTTILGIFVFGVIVCSVVFFCVSVCRYQPMVEHHVYITEKADSSNMEVAYLKTGIDSLVNVVQEHDRLISEKYQHAIEERHSEDSAKSFVVIVIGVLISILGFFGYKSFKDVRESGEKISKDIAKEEAKTEVEKNLPDMIRQEFSREFDGQGLKILEEKLYNSLKIELHKLIEDGQENQVKDLTSRLRDIIKDELFCKNEQETEEIFVENLSGVSKMFGDSEDDLFGKKG